MKSFTKEIWMEAPKRRAIVSIHDEVERLVADSGVQEGLVLINAMHITASVFIKDNDDAHLKRQVMGREVVVAITGGKLHLGPWEHIFYYEFDGRRRKRVLVK